MIAKTGSVAIAHKTFDQPMPEMMAWQVDTITQSTRCPEVRAPTVATAAGGCDPVHFNLQGRTAHAQGWAEALTPLLITGSADGTQEDTKP